MQAESDQKPEDSCSRRPDRDVGEYPKKQVHRWQDCRAGSRARRRSEIDKLITVCFAVRVSASGALFRRRPIAAKSWWSSPLCLARTLQYGENADPDLCFPAQKLLSSASPVLALHELHPIALFLVFHCSVSVLSLASAIHMPRHNFSSRSLRRLGGVFFMCQQLF